MEWLIHADMNTDTLQRMKEIVGEYSGNTPQDLLRFKENCDKEVDSLVEPWEEEREKGKGDLGTLEYYMSQ